MTARHYSGAGAVFSRCGRYRYALWREWRDLFPVGRKTALWVLSNPSTADSEADDPTIRRVVRFTEAAGCSRAEILNRAAFRATDPDDLWTAHKRGIDVAGPRNAATIADAVARGPDLLVAAWGALPLPVPLPRPLRRAWEAGSMLALGLTQDGSPRHPLYVRGDAPLRLVSELRRERRAGRA